MDGRARASSSNRLAFPVIRFLASISVRPATSRPSARIAATEPLRAEWLRLSDPVHRRVSEAIGVRVALTPDVLERHAANLVRK